MTREDLPRVLAIEERSFDSPWTTEQFLASPGGKGRLLEPVLEPLDPAGRPRPLAAYGSAWIVEEEMQINNLAVAGECRRCGFGRMILDHLLAEAAGAGCVEASLEVAADNPAALGLYSAAGFRTTGRRRGYYRKSGADALILSCTLADRL